MALRNLFSKKEPAAAADATPTADATPVDNKETQPDAGVVGSDSNGVDSDGPAVLREEDVVCPPHTTESKLMWKVDYHVVPWLCIMYLLAFLGRSRPAGERAASID